MLLLDQTRDFIHKQNSIDQGRKNNTNNGVCESAKRIRVLRRPEKNKKLQVPKQKNKKTQTGDFPSRGKISRGLNNDDSTATVIFFGPTNLGGQLEAIQPPSWSSTTIFSIFRGGHANGFGRGASNNTASSARRFRKVWTKERLPNDIIVFWKSCVCFVGAKFCNL